MTKQFYAQLIILCNIIIGVLVLMPAPAIAAEPISEGIEEKNNDPLEKLNRKTYQFNSFVDRVALEPITKGYRAILPAWGRARVGAFLRNLATPVTFANNLLQGDGMQAATSFWRFTLNTTFGLGGLFDFAADRGLRDRIEDLGQTAGVYGVSSGPYLVLPFFGPSSLRDATGRVGDVFLDPFNYLMTNEQIIARQAVDIVETRSQNWALVSEIKRTSLDEYATVRSLYLQSRMDLIHNGMQAAPELDYQE